MAGESTLCALRQEASSTHRPNQRTTPHSRTGHLTSSPSSPAPPSVAAAAAFLPFLALLALLLAWAVTCQASSSRRPQVNRPSQSEPSIQMHTQPFRPLGPKPQTHTEGEQSRTKCKRQSKPSRRPAPPITHTHLCRLVSCCQLVRQDELAVVELVQQQHLDALRARPLQRLAPQAARHHTQLLGQRQDCARQGWGKDKRAKDRTQNACALSVPRLLGATHAAAWPGSPSPRPAVLLLQPASQQPPPT